MSTTISVSAYNGRLELVGSALRELHQLIAAQIDHFQVMKCCQNAVLYTNSKNMSKVKCGDLKILHFASANDHHC